ncbi:cytochrome P450 [Mycena capillaripes]|nr:cytochrome P450 [Mycena capillaripes]
MVSFAPIAAGAGTILLIYVVRYISGKLSVRGKLPIASKNEASWWLGHDYLVAKNEVGAEYGRWTKMLGPVFRIKSALWQDDVVIISDHAAVKHIFGQAYTYIKSPAFQPVVVEVVGRGVVWAEGDNLDVIGSVGFGYDFGPESPEGKAILDAWHTDVALFSSFAGFLAPIVIGVAPWITKLPIKALTEDSTAKKVIHQVGRKMLQEPQNLDGTDMFSILARESWQGKSRPDAERRLDDATLLDNILSFFMAGFETTSGTIQLILHDLAQHPEAQNKLRQEILAADSSDIDVIESLPYLDAITREGLRLHPSARDTHRIAIHDDAGEGFIIPFLVLNTDPTVWGSDADQFIPERWLKGGSNPPADELPHGPWGNVSNFVDGPRHCIGWRLAVQEIKLITAAIVKNFELKDTGATVKKLISPAVQPFTDAKAAYLPLGILPIYH